MFLKFVCDVIYLFHFGIQLPSFHWLVKTLQSWGFLITRKFCFRWSRARIGQFHWAFNWEHNLFGTMEQASHHIIVHFIKHSIHEINRLEPKKSKAFPRLLMSFQSCKWTTTWRIFIVASTRASKSFQLMLCSDWSIASKNNLKKGESFGARFKCVNGPIHAEFDSQALPSSGKLRKALDG